MIYVPHLDYAAQKYGPTSSEFKTSLQELDDLIGDVLSFLETSNLAKEYNITILSEYSFSAVNNSISPNAILRDSGFLDVRKIKGKEYIDFEHSKAFAMADHQISHVYTKPGYEQEVCSLFKRCDGIDKIFDKKSQKELHINHSRSGELVLATNSNCWFNYHWWSDENDAPTFTFNVDIHRKPGFDPLELFFDAKKQAISHDLTQLKGSHGLIQEDENSLPLFIMSDFSTKNSKIHATQIAHTISKFFKIDHKFDSKT
jgi:predicted AlkP superfamily pyrophosphatase or phosphodiesterase